MFNVDACADLKGGGGSARGKIKTLKFTYDCKINQNMRPPLETLGIHRTPPLPRKKVLDTRIFCCCKYAPFTLRVIERPNMLSRHDR